MVIYLYNICSDKEVVTDSAKSQFQSCRLVQLFHYWNLFVINRKLTAKNVSCLLLKKLVGKPVHSTPSGVPQSSIWQAILTFFRSIVVHYDKLNLFRTASKRLLVRAPGLGILVCARNPLVRTRERRGIVGLKPKMIVKSFKHI